MYITVFAVNWEIFVIKCFKCLCNYVFHITPFVVLASCENYLLYMYIVHVTQKNSRFAVKFAYTCIYCSRRIKSKYFIIVAMSGISFPSSIHCIQKFQEIQSCFKGEALTCKLLQHFNNKLVQLYCAVQVKLKSLYRNILRTYHSTERTWRRQRMLRRKSVLRT